jgi:hypothetical protein
MNEFNAARTIQQDLIIGYRIVIMTIIPPMKRVDEEDRIERFIS